MWMVCSPAAFPTGPGWLAPRGITHPKLWCHLLAGTSLFCSMCNHSVQYAMPLQPATCFENIFDHEGTRCKKEAFYVNMALLLGWCVCGDYIWRAFSSSRPQTNYRVHSGQKGCGQSGGGVGDGGTVGTVSGFVYVWLHKGKGKKCQYLQDLYYQLTTDISTSEMHKLIQAYKTVSRAYSKL